MACARISLRVRTKLGDIHLVGLDLTGPRVAALFELYELPFISRPRLSSQSDVDENIPGIVARDEAVPFIRSEEFDRAVLHSNVLDPKIDVPNAADYADSFERYEAYS
jgi:hypothetical protein